MMEKQREKRVPCAADHRLDEPTGLSLGMVASPQCPLPFRPAILIVAPRCLAVSTSCLPVIRLKESCRPVKPTRQSAPTVEGKHVSAV
jgi:hypothetical protein